MLARGPHGRNGGVFLLRYQRSCSGGVFLSREDAEKKFLPDHIETGILQDNLFEVLDIKGVGQLMEKAVDAGRKTRSDLKLGICGEHGGEPRSIHFCHRIGINYVSCSGPRVPIARLAAAQAQLLEVRIGS